MRQIVLDTETTGLDPADGHRIIEIGGVEMVNRRLTGNNFHQYINPDREIDAGAAEVHGITNESLTDKPLFAAVAQEFLDYVKGAELLIHNAPFDVGFLDCELRLLGEERGVIEDYCRITDTLAMARKMHPGQRNSLDALCKRYGIDNSHRELHGALLDSEILADVYLMLTGGQCSLALDAGADQTQGDAVMATQRVDADRAPLKVRRAGPQELEAHQKIIEKMQASGSCVWAPPPEKTLS